MIVEYCGSKFAGSEPNTVEQLLQVLLEEPLNPKFEEYGNFVLDAGDGIAHVWGNFFNYSHVFSIKGTPDEVRPLVEAIRANQKTQAYRDAKQCIRDYDAQRAEAARTRRRSLVARGWRA